MAEEKSVERAMAEAEKFGAVRATLYFDAHSPQEDAVRAAIVDFIGRLGAFPGVIYCKGDLFDTIENKNFSGGKEFMGSAKVDMVTDNFNTLVNVCLRFAPMAVELVTPQSIKLNGEQAQTVLLDISQASQDFAEFIYKGQMTPEDHKKLVEDLKRRIQLGKEILEKSKKEKK